MNKRTFSKRHIAENILLALKGALVGFGAIMPGISGGTLCVGCILRKENPAPAVLARRGMGAGSACGAEEHAGSTSPRLCRA